MGKQKIKNRINGALQIRRFEIDFRYLELIHANEMTQEELAKEAGELTRQTIIALEAQKYSPSLEIGFRISKVFNVLF